MADPELRGEAGTEGTEASEALMNGFILVFMCVLAATLVMNHTLGHKLHVSPPSTSPPFPSYILHHSFLSSFSVAPGRVNVLNHSLIPHSLIRHSQPLLPPSFHSTPPSSST